MITPRQIRAGRALLLFNQVELAARARISLGSLKRIELSVDQITGKASTVERIQKALEDAGIIFIDQDLTNGPGVRLRDRVP